MKAEKITTYTPQFGAAKISAKAFIPVISRGESYPPRNKFVRNVRDIFGEIFPKLDPDYDVFFRIGAEPENNSYEINIIDKILRALH